MPWHRAQQRPAPGDRIVLLHGLWRSYHAMDGLAEELHQAGYETLNIPYPSSRKSIADLAEHVVAEIPQSEKTTHFVTHSMGGIVLRELIKDHLHLLSGKVVMLAPPNQGSEIIDWLEDFPPAKWTLGPGGLQLSTHQVTRNVPAFPEEIDVSVIMGNRCHVPFFKTFLGPESDGVVSVAGGEVDGMTRLQVVDCDHTFIMTDPTVRDAVLGILRETP